MTLPDKDKTTPSGSPNPSGPTTSTGPAGSDGTPGRSATAAVGGPDTGSALRSIYQKTVEEQIPADLMELLGKLT